MKKVYVIREDFYHEGDVGEKCDTYIRAVYGNLENAVKAINDIIDNIHDDITGGDENEESRVSFMKHWNGVSASIEDDNCAVWKLSMTLAYIEDEK